MGSTSTNWPTEYMQDYRLKEAIMISTGKSWGLPVAALLLAGCSMDGPVAPPEPAAGDLAQLLSC